MTESPEGKEVENVVVAEGIVNVAGILVALVESVLMKLQSVLVERKPVQEMATSSEWPQS